MALGFAVSSNFGFFFILPAMWQAGQPHRLLDSLVSRFVRFGHAWRIEFKKFKTQGLQPADINVTCVGQRCHNCYTYLLYTERTAKA